MAAIEGLNALQRPCAVELFIEEDPFQRSAAGQREQGWAKSHLSVSARTKLGFLLDIYGKDEKDDLSREEKKVLASLANRIKEAAKRR